MAITADDYEIKINLKNQQRSIHIYQLKNKKYTYARFFFELTFFNTSSQTNDKMDLCFVLHNGDGYLTFQCGNYETRITSIAFNAKERLHWIINDVIYKIDTWIMDERTQVSLKRMILGLE